MSIDTAGYWCGEGKGHKCGYCNNEKSSISTGIYLHFSTPKRYNAMIDRGWRRSGVYLYKPSMQKTCCPQYSIKCDVVNFRISRSQKKVIKHFSNYLEHSIPGSLPNRSSYGVGHMSEMTTNVSKPPIEFNNKHLSNEVLKSAIASPFANTNFTSTNKSSSFKTPDLTPKQSGSHSSTVYKTGTMLSQSNKKRDFRRLRKLKKIAENLGVSWETLDVRDLGNQRLPLSLTERLSKIDNNSRLRLCLVRISKEPSSEFQQTFTESHLLFQKYQMSVHNDTEDECTVEQFNRFLCTPPFDDNANDLYGAFHQQYYMDGKLVAVGVVDILPWSISSVYFYYDPLYKNLSFGVLSALLEIHLTQQMQAKVPALKWYYMGFYIHDCIKMKYKSLFKPSYLLCPKSYSWWSVEQCKPLLDVNKYQEFYKIDPTAEDHEKEVSEDDLMSMKVLFNKRLFLYPVYREICEEDEYKEILAELINLAGQENAENMCVFH